MQINRKRFFCEICNSFFPVFEKNTHYTSKAHIQKAKYVGKRTSSFVPKNRKMNEKEINDQIDELSNSEKSSQKLVQQNYRGIGPNLPNEMIVPKVEEKKNENMNKNFEKNFEYFLKQYSIEEKQKKSKEEIQKMKMESEIQIEVEKQFKKMMDSGKVLSPEEFAKMQSEMEPQKKESFSSKEKKESQIKKEILQKIDKTDYYNNPDYLYGEEIEEKANEKEKEEIAKKKKKEDEEMETMMMQKKLKMIQNNELREDSQEEDEKRKKLIEEELNQSGFVEIIQKKDFDNNSTCSKGEEGLKNDEIKKDTENLPISITFNLKKKK